MLGEFTRPTSSMRLQRACYPMLERANDFVLVYSNTITFMEKICDYAPGRT